MMVLHSDLRTGEHLQTRERICELGRLFYNLGWASGTGGGISIREGDVVYMAPSGVQKERIQPADIFCLDLEGRIVDRPADDTLHVSECAPLFMAAYHLRDAGAVIHSHSLSAAMVTLAYDQEFHITGMEMQKGIRGSSVSDTLVVPIIENTNREADLAQSLSIAINSYGQSDAVLVRGHGVYVWSETWQKAKTQAECYDYLFRAALEMKQLGLKTELQKNVEKWRE